MGRLRFLGVGKPWIASWSQLNHSIPEHVSEFGLRFAGGCVPSAGAARIHELGASPPTKVVTQRPKPKLLAAKRFEPQCCLIL